MINGNELEELKKYIGPDGKLIISDDLSDAKKERFQFINDLNLDLIEVLSRNTAAKMAAEPQSNEPDIDDVDLNSPIDDDDDDLEENSSFSSEEFATDSDYSVDLNDDGDVESLNDLDDMF